MLFIKKTTALFLLSISATFLTAGCATICPEITATTNCNSQAQHVNHQQNSENPAQPDSEGWILQFEDLGEVPWQDNWFLDGRSAKVTNTQKGIQMIAGPEPKNDAHHAVLWTKQQFSGDVKIEYDFTKIDDMQTMVNILFIQATGIGGEFAEDISLWNHRRQVPSMKFYFERMELLHISYAAYGQVNDEPDNDYIRARAYPLHPETGFKGMEIPPSYFSTGLFKKGITYNMEVEKNQKRMTLSVKAKNTPNALLQTFTWKLPARGQVSYGRIGLRQMYTRSSIYNNFRVYTR
jgi:hypothetical protein